MKKFSHIRKIYEQDENVANLPGNLPTNSQTFLPNTGQAQSIAPNNTENQEIQGTQSVPQVPVQQTVEQGTQQEQTQEQTPSENTDQTGVGSVVSLFSKLFESREMAHIYHLQVNGEQGSHASHVALNDYYDKILDFIDDLIETYTGQYGIVDGYNVIDTKDTRTKDKIEYFEALAIFIKHARQAISVEDSHLHNIIDEIIALIYKTLYKLKFTK